MEGRYPNAIMLTLAECSDRSHLDEWLDWYARIHTPDVTSAGIFVDMIRFMNTDSDHGGRQIANLSETDFANPLDALEELKRRRAPFSSESRRSEFTNVVAGGGPMIKVGGQFQAVKNAPVRGIFIEATTLLEQSEEEAFNRWYNDEHVASVLTTGVFQSAYRYQGISPSGPTNSYICIYETEREDANVALHESRESGHREVVFGGMELAWEMTARRIWPLEGR